jgi:hypothetical protein
LELSNLELSNPEEWELAQEQQSDADIATAFESDATHERTSHDIMHNQSPNSIPRAKGWEVNFSRTAVFSTVNEYNRAQTWSTLCVLMEKIILSK